MWCLPCLWSVCFASITFTPPGHWSQHTGQEITDSVSQLDCRRIGQVKRPAKDKKGIVLHIKYNRH